VKALYFSSQRAALPGGEEGLFIGGVKICPLGLSCSRPDMSGGGRTCPVGVFWKDTIICPVGCGLVRWCPDMSGGVRTCPVGVFWKDIFICPVRSGLVRWGADMSGGIRTCPVGVFWKDIFVLASPLDFSRPSL